jgi:hypothetical protein
MNKLTSKQLCRVQQALGWASLLAGILSMWILARELREKLLRARLRLCFCELENTSLRNQLKVFLAETPETPETPAAAAENAAGNAVETDGETDGETQQNA